MSEEVNLWDEIMDDELHKQIYNVGFQKGRLEQKKEELEFLLKIQNWFDTATGQAYEVNDKIMQLQKEIGGNEK